MSKQGYYPNQQKQGVGIKEGNMRDFDRWELWYHERERETLRKQRWLNVISGIIVVAAGIITAINLICR